ncbi:MAG: type IV pilin protein [Rhodanobacter sp.]|nr:MAG: type IV pilin protein [Rhodanobacter sp.]
MEARDGKAMSMVRWGRSAGFTLIELMIVVAIVAILTAIAYPAYTSYITKTHRVAAEGCLSEYANYMERYYTTNLRYDTSSASPTVANPFPMLDCAMPQRTGANYSYNDGTPGVSTYTVQAVPINAQLTRDTKCGTLSLNQAGVRTVSGPGTVDQCW